MLKKFKNIIYKKIIPKQDKENNNFIYISIGTILLIYFIINSIYNKIKNTYNSGLIFNISPLDIGIISIIAITLLIIKVTKKLKNRKDKNE